MMETTASVWRESESIRALLAWSEADMKTQDERATVQCLYSRGRSIRQIAAWMAFSRNTVRSILRTAKAQAGSPPFPTGAGTGPIPAGAGMTPVVGSAGPVPISVLAGGAGCVETPTPSSASPEGESGLGEAPSLVREKATKSVSAHPAVPLHPPISPRRSRKLDGLEEWLEERCERHRGNAAVIRQELAAEHGRIVSLRSVERAVKPWRDLVRRETNATVRFETPPGEQLQADFGETWTLVAGERTKIHLCVLTLGFSRRLYVSVHRDQRQAAWLAGFEAAFRHWGGVPETLLIDNAKALIKSHDSESGQVIPAEELKQFALHWGIQIRACAPYRARTKGKVESGVKYVKRNAIAGRDFSSWAALEAHLVAWTREIADQRIHGTTGETPLERFERAEKAVLRPIDDHPGYRHLRRLERKVQTDAHVAVDAGFYSVPWRLIGHRVQVHVSDAQIRILYLDQEVAIHARNPGPRRRSTDPAHLDGILSGIVSSRWALRFDESGNHSGSIRTFPTSGDRAHRTGQSEARPDPPKAALGPDFDLGHRPLAAYQAVIDESP